MGSRTTAPLSESALQKLGLSLGLRSGLRSLPPARRPEHAGHSRLPFQSGAAIGGGALQEDIPGNFSELQVVKGAAGVFSVARELARGRPLPDILSHLRVNGVAEEG